MKITYANTFIDLFLSTQFTSTDVHIGEVMVTISNIHLHVVQMGTTTKKLMSPSDLVLPITKHNNIVPIVDTYPNHIKYVPFYYFLESATTINATSLQTQIRLCKLYAIRNNMTHLTFVFYLNMIINEMYYNLRFHKSIQNRQHKKIFDQCKILCGGGVVSKETWTSKELQEYIDISLEEGIYRFDTYASMMDSYDINKIVINIPLLILINRLSSRSLQKICDIHNITYTQKERVKATFVHKIRQHVCEI